jgi:hypothetical protein
VTRQNNNGPAFQQNTRRRKHIQTKMYRASSRKQSIIHPYQASKKKLPDSKLSLAPICLPWPVKGCNAHMNHAIESISTELNELGINTAFNAKLVGQVATWVAWSFPQTTKQAYTLATRIIFYLMSIDDVIDVSKDITEGAKENIYDTADFVKNWRSHESATEPYHVFFYSTMIHIEDIVKDIPGHVEWMQFLCQEIQDYLIHGCLQMSNWWEKEVMPEEEDFLQAREHDVMIPIFIALLELCQPTLPRVLLPRELVSTLLFKKLRQATARSVALLNDFSSFYKEYVIEKKHLIHLKLLMFNSDIEFVPAFYKSIQFTNKHIMQVVQAKQEILDSTRNESSELGTAIEHFVTCHEELVRGYWDMSFVVHRYYHPDHPFLEYTAPKNNN